VNNTLHIKFEQESLVTKFFKIIIQMMLTTKDEIKILAVHRKKNRVCFAQAAEAQFCPILHKMCFN